MKPVRRKKNEDKRPHPSDRKLVEMRERVGLTRYAFATLTYVDDRYLKRLESGSAHRPGRGLLLRMAMVLVDYTSLFDRGHVDDVLAATEYPPSPEQMWTPRCACVCGDGRKIGG